MQFSSFLYSVYNKFRRDLHLRRFTRESGCADAKSIFSFYHAKNLFGSKDSLSGTGSSLEATRTIRMYLPGLLADLGIEKILDIPCDDFFWAKEIDWNGLEYTGADVVEALVAHNAEKYGRGNIRFKALDILEDDLPEADLILCRDLFIHFPNDHVLKALGCIKRSGAKYLLTTHYTGVDTNRDIPLGSFRPINLQRAPFCLPAPDRALSDGDYLDLWKRTLSLWPVEDLP
ncbi:MAG: class I SAM-dependent methyltransferase [Rhodospirillales bacterium]